MEVGHLDTPDLCPYPAIERLLCITSLGSDGSIIERDARRSLFRDGFAECITRQIPHPEGSQSEAIKVQILCLHGRYMAIIQDPKHFRKTG